MFRVISTCCLLRFSTLQVEGAALLPLRRDAAHCDLQSPPASVSTSNSARQQYRSFWANLVAKAAGEAEV